MSQDKEIADFNYFTGLQDNKDFDASFAIMQKVYVLNKDEVLTKEDVMQALKKLRKTLI